MTIDLQRLRFETEADVYKAGLRAGRLVRIPGSGIEFRYLADYIERADSVPVATTLPLTVAPVLAPAGALPAFFAGLLPEGRRLTMLQNAVKTSLDDELTLLLAVGGDVPGDVQVVPAGASVAEPSALIRGDVSVAVFRELVDQVDLHALPGVQDKLSAQMISSPVSTDEGRFILKLDPPAFPHLTRNEAAHLVAARSLRIPVASGRLVSDSRGDEGLLVRRFDRVRHPDGLCSRLPFEDATQVLGLPSADKYRVDAATAVLALAGSSQAPRVAVRNLYLQFVFAWLTGNGDLHAKNIGILGDDQGSMRIAPIYDVPSTLVYGDDTSALPVAGREKNLRRRHWREFAAEIGLPERAVASADAIALRAAAGVDLELLGYEGSPLRGARRELGFRRAELSV